MTPDLSTPTRRPVLTLVGGTAVTAKAPSSPLPTNVPNTSGWPIFGPSLFALPFVTLPTEQCSEWGEFWRKTVMWNDDPTTDGCADHQRGKEYARMAVAAILHDRASSRGLEITVAALVERALRRRGPAGKLCRQVSSAETAFLYELCQMVIAWGRL